MGCLSKLQTRAGVDTRKYDPARGPGGTGSKEKAPPSLINMMHRLMLIVVFSPVPYRLRRSSGMRPKAATVKRKKSGTELLISVTTREIYSIRCFISEQGQSAENLCRVTLDPSLRHGITEENNYRLRLGLVYRESRLEERKLGIRLSLNPRLPFGGRWGNYDSIAAISAEME